MKELIQKRSIRLVIIFLVLAAVYNLSVWNKQEKARRAIREEIPLMDASTFIRVCDAIENKDADDKIDCYSHAVELKGNILKYYNRTVNICEKLAVMENDVQSQKLADALAGCQTSNTSEAAAFDVELKVDHKKLLKFCNLIDGTKTNENFGTLLDCYDEVAENTGDISGCDRMREMHKHIDHLRSDYSDPISHCYFNAAGSIVDLSKAERLALCKKKDTYSYSGFCYSKIAAVLQDPSVCAKSKSSDYDYDRAIKSDCYSESQATFRSLLVLWPSDFFFHF